MVDTIAHILTLQFFGVLSFFCNFDLIIVIAAKKEVSILFKVDAITVADLRKDKLFVKLAKKLQKDMEEQKKRHLKQRESIQKQQVRKFQIL